MQAGGAAMRRLIIMLAVLAWVSPALATNYFNWDCETSTTSLGAVESWGDNTSLTTSQAHGGTHSMQISPVGGDLNQQLGAETGNFSYGFNAFTGTAIYYRWWMKIPTTFDWGSSWPAKTKSNRVLSSTAKYTGYMFSDGFGIGECTDQAACLAQGGASNSSDEEIKIDVAPLKDNTWHEYIVMIKPNTSGSSLNAQFHLWIDNSLVGTYDDYKLTNADYAMSEAWGGWMVRPYWQQAAGSGGTIYLDDFSVDDVYNSTYSEPSEPATVTPHGAFTGLGECSFK